MIRFSFVTIAVATVLAFAVASCSSADGVREAGVIDVAGAVAQPEELRVSDLGKRIRYVPLETTDSSLVSSTWVLTAADGAFLVSNLGFRSDEVPCLAFDTAGRFISSVGHLGQDPEAYMSSFVVLAPDSRSAYFQSTGMQHYSFDGKYLGSAPRGGMIGGPGVTVAVDTMFITVNDSYVGMNGPRCFSIYSQGLNSTAVDTTDIIPYPEDADNPEIGAVQNLWSHKGVMQNGFAWYHELQKGKVFFYLEGGVSQVWRVGDEVHHRRIFSDTIYAVTPASADAVYLFDCGDNRVDQSAIDRHEEIDSDALFVAELFENRDMIVFGASRGWLRDDDHETFVGVYDKRTGRTRAAAGRRGFVDDLSGFLPFYPAAVTPDGHFVGVITMEDIGRYREENPEAELPSEIAGLDDDANPVLVIVGD